jgi:catechol 2,3-dioxygenase-like lactoylglutathione lyase family enzyme
MTPLRCLQMNHINAVVDSFDDSVAHFENVFGAQLLSDMPRDEWHACLITIGTVIFELFVPHDDLLHARFGPHYIGIEYVVPDVDEAREVVLARGMRIVRELGVAFHIHPLDSLGVAFEFYDRSFHHDPPMPFLEPIKPMAYWRDEHPLGCTGLKRYSIAVSDMEAAARFLEDFVGAAVLYEEPRPAVGARAVGVAVGESVAELLMPVEEGAISRHLARYGEGIRSTVFGVRDLAQAESYLKGLGIRLQPGDTAGSVAVDPADNRGLLFELENVGG